MPTRAELGLAAAAIAALVALGAAIGCYKGAAPEATAPDPLHRPSPPAASARAAASSDPDALDGGLVVGAFDGPPDPDAQRVLREALTHPAVPFDPGNPPKVTLRGLDDTALGEAQGMTPDGPPRVVTLKQGQRAEEHVTLQPRACMTYVAEGGLGVAEVDVFLATGTGDDLKILAQDQRGGPIGVVGGRTGCVTNPASTPLEASLHVTLRRGAGVVVLRGYAK
ncbi:MAG TPA: hypothetical protein VGM56_02320 [Byssovorax sp.]|jgi:hypothetical protein